MLKNYKPSTAHKVIATIAGIVVTAIGVQFVRFIVATKPLINGQTIVLPANYFPFNRSYTRLNDKVKKTA